MALVPWQVAAGYVPAPSPEDIRAGGVHNAPRARKGSVYGGLGGDLLRATTSIAGGAQSVKALQTFLRNRGYNISVDGIRGPQTAAAVQAYHQGVSARAWNTRSQHAGTAGGQRVRVAPRTPVRGPVRGTGPTVSGGRAPRIPQIAGPVAGAGAGAAGVDTAQMTDEQQAQAMVEAEFGPQMAALQRAAAQAQAQGSANAAQIGKVYGEVAGTATQAGQLTQSANAQLLQGQDTANQNLLGLFGGPSANGPAGEAAAFADINRGELAQYASSQQAFDANMVPVIQTQGANAQASALAEAQQQMAEYLAQMQDITAQRGAAQTKATYDIQQNRLQNEAAQQSLDLARQLMPSQVAEARASATKAGVEAAWAPKLAAQQAKAFGVSQARARAELRQTQAQTKKILADLAAPDGSIDLSDPNTRSSLGDRLRGSIQTKAGTWRMHPGLAQQNLNIALQQLGLSGNPQARAIASGLLQETVNNSMSRGMWTQFKFSNGKIVKGSRTALGRKNYKKQQANKK